MKISLSSFRPLAVIGLVGVALFTAGCATTTTVQTTQTQTPAQVRSPLTGKEMVERLRGGAKQADLAAEVKQRGIVEVSAADMDGLKSAGASAELMDVILTSLAKGPPNVQSSPTVVYRDRYPWVWNVYPWWAPHLGFNWHWHYRRR